MNEKMETLNGLDTLINAQTAISLGLVPIPLNGKQPMIKNWQDVKLDNALDHIIKKLNPPGCQGFESQSPYLNIGVLTGKPSNIVVVDIDIKDDGLQTWNELISQHSIPNTFTVQTGSGGYHYYFTYNDDVKDLKNSSRCINKKGIDFKTTGGQVVFINSIHPDTHNLYSIINNTSINTIPSWLLDILSQSIISFKYGCGSTPHNINLNCDITINPKISIDALGELLNQLNIERARDYNSWIRVVWAIKSVSDTDPYKYLAYTFSMRCPNKYELQVFEKIWLKGVKNQINLGSLLFWLEEDIGREKYNIFTKKYNIRVNTTFKKCFEMGDDGHTHLFIEQLKGEVKVSDIKHGVCYIWNNSTKLWIEGIPSCITNKIVEILPPILEVQYMMAMNEKVDGPEREKDKEVKCRAYHRILKNSYNIGHCRNVMGFSLVRLYDPTFIDKLDSNNDFLPLKGGKVLNLLTGEVRTRIKEDMFSFE